MARKQSVPLTEAEQRVMEALWRLGTASVGEVLDALPEAGRPAQNSVQTITTILERKAYVRHQTRGRAFIYSPVIDRGAAARTALSYVTARFFGGSPAEVALNLIDDKALTNEQLDDLRRRIDAAKRGAR